MEYLAWISLGMSTMVALFTVWTEYTASRKRTAVEKLGVSDEIAAGAKTLIELTRAELDREIERRVALEKEVYGLKVQLDALRVELTNAVNCSLLLYGQLVSSGIKPVVEPKRINGD
jgi:hypothetical protein